MSAIFSDTVLTLDERPRFSLSRAVDFFILDNEIFVLDKRHVIFALRLKDIAGFANGSHARSGKITLITASASIV